MLEFVDPLVQAEETLTQRLVLAYNPVDHVLIYREAFSSLEFSPIPPNFHSSPLNAPREGFGALTKKLKRLQVCLLPPVGLAEV